MKMKVKMIGSEYIEEMGYSYVTIATDCGLFTGEAWLHPDDIEVASSYAGCGYAEIRALIQYMKRKAYIADYQLQAVMQIKKDLDNRKYRNENSIEYKLIQKQVYMLEDEKQQFKTHARTLKEKLNTSIEEREAYLKKILNKKEQGE